MEFFDTHCHIHSAIQDGGEAETRKRWRREDGLTPDSLVRDAVSVGVTRMVCVGTTVADSHIAVDFVQKHPETWASIGIHPHEAKEYAGNSQELKDFTALATQPKVVAIGECGLDFYYEHSPKADQIRILEFQLDLAQKQGLPVIFHVRDAFDDFWPILDNFRGIQGVIHSFTSTTRVLDEALSRGLYIGLNGIMTFTKDEEQLAAAKAIPLGSLVLETDAPFLTPAPHRGTICTPSHVIVTAEFLSKLRGELVEMLSRASTENARKLFNL